MRISTGIEDLVSAKRTGTPRVGHEHGASRVRVFGSVARGESGPESDLDLSIDMGSGGDLIDMVAIRQGVEDVLGREVHVVTEAAMSPSLREPILLEAVPFGAATRRIFDSLLTRSTASPSTSRSAKVAFRARRTRGTRSSADRRSSARRQSVCHRNDGRDTRARFGEPTPARATYSSRTTLA